MSPVDAFNRPIAPGDLIFVDVDGMRLAQIVEIQTPKNGDFFPFKLRSLRYYSVGLTSSVPTSSTIKLYWYGYFAVFKVEDPVVLTWWHTAVRP
jgi:hypothetical protein